MQLVKFEPICLIGRCAHTYTSHALKVRAVIDVSQQIKREVEWGESQEERRTSVQSPSRITRASSPSSISHSTVTPAEKEGGRTRHQYAPGSRRDMGKIQRSASEGVHRVRHRAVWWCTRRSPETLVLRHIALSEPHLTAMSGTLRLCSGFQRKTLRLRICVSVPAGKHPSGVQVVEERAVVTVKPMAATRFERNRATS